MGEYSRACPDCKSEACVGERAANAISQTGRVSRWNKPPSLAVKEDFACATVIAGDDGQSHSSSLCYHAAKRFRLD